MNWIYRWFRAKVRPLIVEVVIEVLAETKRKR